jgi:hypothetical protein
VDLEMAGTIIQVITRQFKGVAVHVVVITRMNVLVVFLAGEAIIVTIRVEVIIVLTTHMNTNIKVDIKHKLTVLLFQEGIK